MTRFLAFLLLAVPITKPSQIKFKADGSTLERSAASKWGDFKTATDYGDGSTNGIASAITACGTVNPCTVWIPSTYPTTEAVPGAVPSFLAYPFGFPGATTSANITIVDLRYNGGFYKTAVDPIGGLLSTQPNYMSWNVYVTNHYRSLGAQASMNVVNTTISQMALDNGANFNENGYTNKTNWVPLDVRHDGYTPGQHIGVQAWINNYSVGDTLGFYAFNTCYGGYSAGGDEGCEGIDNIVKQGPVQYTGTISSGGSTGSTSLTISPTAGHGTQGAGRYLIRQSAGTVSAGTISAITWTNLTTPLNLTGSGTGWAVGNVNTTLGTAVTAPGVATVTPAAMTNITTSTVLCIADPTQFEMVIPSATTGTTFTANFSVAHPTTAIVAAGGMCGYFIELVADRATTGTFGTTNTLRFVWPVIRTTSATSMDVWDAHPVQGYIQYQGRWAAAGTTTYVAYQGAEVASVQSGGVLSNTLTLRQNGAAWTNADTVELTQYFSMNVFYGNSTFTKYFTSAAGAAAGVFNINLNGLWGGNAQVGAQDRAIAVTNNTPDSVYTSGTFLPPQAGFLMDGRWTNGLYSVYSAQGGANWRIGCPKDGCAGSIINMQNINSAGSDWFSYDLDNKRFWLSTNNRAGAYTFGIGLDLPGKVSTYNAVATAGWGVAAVHGTPVLLTAQTANLAATNVYAAAPVGEYRVCATARTTTSGTGTTATLNIIWTDEGGVKTDLVGTWALNSVTVTGQINKCEYIHATAASAIQVSVTAGTYGTSVYAISATAERLN